MARILYVTTSTTVGGAEKTLYTLATLLDPRKHPVAGVVSLKPKGPYAARLEAAGVPTRSLDILGRPSLSDLVRLAVSIRESRPDVVHAFMYQAIQLCRAARLLGYARFKLVSSPRVNYRTRDDLTLLLDGLLKRADDLLVTESESSRRYLLERRGYPESKLARVYNGVDIAGWTVSKAERARKRESLGLGPDDYVLGTVGRLDEQKGHAFLLEAVAKLRAVRPVKCLIIGDGPLREKLSGLVGHLRLEREVLLLGERPDVPAWLCALDAFVLPSLWEGLPNALLEAMALGLPVVASEVDGIPEVVRREFSGMLCPPKDSQALASAVQDLMADPALGRRLGEGARRVIAENFRLADMIARYEETYERVHAG